jgi:hypothetical protein
MPGLGILAIMNCGHYLICFDAACAGVSDGEMVGFAPLATMP